MILQTSKNLKSPNCINMINSAQTYSFTSFLFFLLHFFLFYFQRFQLCWLRKIFPPPPSLTFFWIIIKFSVYLLLTNAHRHSSGFSKLSWKALSLLYHNHALLYICIYHLYLMPLFNLASLIIPAPRLKLRNLFFLFLMTNCSSPYDCQL